MVKKERLSEGNFYSKKESKEKNAGHEGERDAKKQAINCPFAKVNEGMRTDHRPLAPTHNTNEMQSPAGH